MSYPITAIKESDPELLKRIQGEILSELEESFVVFNPLSIKDMSLTYDANSTTLSGSIAEISDTAKKIIKSRTVERDYRFIDQSDATVVIYPTDKLSPGVLSEINYSFNNQKPVFIYFDGPRSPFIEANATYLTNDLQDLKETALALAQ